MYESSFSSREPHDGMSVDEWNAYVEKTPFFFVLCACATARLPQVDEAAQRPDENDFQLIYELNRRGSKLEVRYNSLGQHIVLLSRIGLYEQAIHHRMLALALKAQAGWLAERGPIFFIDPLDDHLVLQRVLPFEGLAIGSLALAIGDMIQKTIDWRDTMDGKPDDSPPSPAKRFPNFSVIKGV